MHVEYSIVSIKVTDYIRYLNQRFNNLTSCEYEHAIAMCSFHFDSIQETIRFVYVSGIRSLTTFTKPHLAAKRLKQRYEIGLKLLRS